MNKIIILFVNIYLKLKILWRQKLIIEYTCYFNFFFFQNIL